MKKLLELLPIDFRKTWPDSATGRDRTEAARDRSWYLKSLLATTQTHSTCIEICSELQFTFLMVLTLNNYSCLAQWRRLTTLVFTCKNLVIEDPHLFSRAIGILTQQLDYVAENDDDSHSISALFELDDERTGRAWFQGLLGDFVSSMNDLYESMASSDTSERLEAVVDATQELQQTLEEKLDWRRTEGPALKRSNEQQRQQSPASKTGVTYLRRGTLQLEDGETVEMDMGTSADYDRENEEGEYAPVIVDLS